VEIGQVPHKTLLTEVAGRLTAFLLDGAVEQGAQIPAERELIGRLGVSRATLREALRFLADRGLLEARPGVGWFVRSPDARYLSDLHELARPYRQPPPRTAGGKGEPAPNGPRRLSIVGEKPLHVPNLQTDRLGTFELISWWEREKVEAARVLVVGAGALGNEVVKNLALMGIGYIYLIDFDSVEAANLSRSVFFREDDTGRTKAEVVAARAKSLNPDIHVQYLHGDVTTQLGLGVIRRMDVVIGCLDNREARLAVNRFCYWMNKPWVDGAIQEWLGLARVFVPGQGACYECTLTEQARRELSLRYSCPLLARTDILLGKVPTTPTIASLIGAMEAQEALKLIHGLPVEAGKVIHYNGSTNDMYTSAYLPRADCESHWTYGDVAELPLRSGQATLAEMLRLARADLGPEAVLDLDQELIVALECRTCHTVDRILRPLSEVSLRAAHCPSCGQLRETHMIHRITGEEDFLDHTLASVGVPPLHILRAHNSLEYRFYELTGDLEEALHFHHFEGGRSGDGRRIRLGGEVGSPEPARSASRRQRVVFKD
jgi:adenylyltransferase/sulfurtransferase